MINLNQNNTYPIAPFLRSGFRVFFMAAGLAGVVFPILNIKSSSCHTPVVRI
jgi:uncharacterized protein involved in response to NO